LKKALVIHPWFPVFGGGELLCLYVCKTLQDNGFQVSLVTDIFDPDKAEAIYGMGSVMRKCRHIPVPEFKPFHPPIARVNLYAVQRIFHTRRVKNLIKDEDADVVFSTQSSVFLTRGGLPAYHFLYNITDLFAFPSSLSEEAIKRYFGEKAKGLGFRWRMYYWGLSRIRNTLLGKPDPKIFFALSQQVFEDLRGRGFQNSVMIHPPARLNVFHPKPKKKRVVTACRIVPPKRLEDFFEIARRLPEQEFLIVGRDSPDLKTLYQGYSENLMKNRPDNVKYVEAALRDVPELLEESQVYLYCGVEPGMGIAVIEAAGAGCVLVTPNIGGSSEVVKSLRIGFTFENIEDATRLVRIALELKTDPEEIRSKTVDLYSPESFMEKIQNLLS
jgi:glycosyltransferase involved in cell wall biosynthesis